MIWTLHQLQGQAAIPARPLTIGRLSALTGVKVETIRYYERVKLISPPARTEGNYRSYAVDDVVRLEFIRRTRALGFPVDEVRALLALSAERDRPCDKVDELATRHLAEVHRKIADLQGLRRELASAINSCAGGRVRECRILEAFSDAVMPCA